MPLTLSLKKALIFIVTMVAIMATAAYLLLPKFLDIDTYKEEILTELQNSLNRQVSYSSGKFTIDFGPAISFSDVVIKEPDGRSTFVTIKRLTCRIALMPLLHKHVVITGLDADSPTAVIERHADGLFNFSDLLEQKGASSGISIHHMRVKNGEIKFTDRKIATSGLVTRLTSVNLYLSSLSRGKKCDLKLSGEFKEGASGKFSIGGKARIAPPDKSLSETVLDLKFTMDQLDASSFWPYYGSQVPFKKVLGRIDVDAAFKGRLGDFDSSGNILVNDLRFDYQPVFKGPLTPKKLRLDFNVNVSDKDIIIKKIELAVDGVDIKGNCSIRDINTSDPRITAQAVTSSFDFEKCNVYIPYGIIVKDTSEWIEQHITGGIFRLDDGKLDGRISQILHMEKGTNYNALYIKGRVDNGKVSYGSNVPTFNGISGTLEMKGKDFSLHEMSGRFGTAPFTMEGRITDYPLDKPSGYPFKMNINPGQTELAWLLGKSRAGSIFYNGNSTLSLSGEGYTSKYQITGNWNLTNSNYSYTNLISKPVGISSAISFRMELSPEEFAVPSLQYSLGTMALNVSAKRPFAEGSKLGLAINSNLFNIGDVAGLVPAVGKYHPSGKIQLALKGESVPTGSDTIRWGGSVAMINASITPATEIKPISAINGTIAFDGTAMESSRLTARIGNTTVNGRGSVTSIDPLIFHSTFTSPSVDLADFGFKNTDSLKISGLQGDVTYKENSLQIRSLSGQLNESKLSLAGAIDDLDNLSMDLSVHASYLKVEDILALAEPERTSGKDSPSLKLTATIKADSGIYSDIRFDKLSTTAQLANRIVYLQPLEASVYGGHLSAKGRIDTLSPINRYQMEFKLTGASASQVLTLFSLDERELTGSINAEGEITAKGKTAEELKKTVLGSIRAVAQNGALRQFSALSKVFSILNVSQLFKFKLPDMVSEGMPYNSIKATISVKDGTVSTRDLFITSNAMNMSLIGAYDYMHDNMDFTLGIKPLQTVDKVVSKIPIVGWILTGKDKSLITTYFEIRGKSDNPQVSAIPVKYIGKGVLDIFKRVFQLPAKLVTDTGEVILGN